MAYQMTCDMGDDFMVQSDDEEEVPEHVKEHAQERHDQNLSDDEAREKVQQAS